MINHPEEDLIYGSNGLQKGPEHISKVDALFSKVGPYDDDLQYYNRDYDTPGNPESLVKQLDLSYHKITPEEGELIGLQNVAFYWPYRSIYE